MPAAFTRSAKAEDSRQGASGDRAALVGDWLAQPDLINAIASKGGGLVAGVFRLVSGRCPGPSESGLALYERKCGQILPLSLRVPSVPSGENFLASQVFYLKVYMKSQVPNHCYLLRRSALAILLGISSSTPAVSQSAEDELFDQYNREIAAAVTPSERQQLYAFWSKRFDQYLQSRPVRELGSLTLMAERGAIQSQLGQHREAMESWLDLERAAAQLGATRARHQALDTAWSLMARSLPDMREHVEQRIEEATRAMLSTPQDLDATHVSRLSSLYREVGSFHFAMGENHKALEPSVAETSYQRSEKWLQNALAIGPPEQSRRLDLHFDLGKTQLALGDGTAASAQFDQILESRQDRYAPMWVAHLKLKAASSIDTGEYVAGIDQILRQYPEDEYLLPLKQEQARSYLKQARYKEAAATFESIVGLDSADGPNATNMFLLAGTYEHLGRMEDARQLLAEILRRYPEAGSAQLAQQRLSFLDNAVNGQLALNDLTSSEVVAAELNESIHSIDESPRAISVVASKSGSTASSLALDTRSDPSADGSAPSAVLGDASSQWSIFIVITIMISGATFLLIGRRSLNKKSLA